MNALKCSASCPVTCTPITEDPIKMQISVQWVWGEATAAGLWAHLEQPLCRRRAILGIRICLVRL